MRNLNQPILRSLKMIPSYLAFVGFLLISPQLFSQTAPNAQYATFSPGVLDPAVTMLTGTGSFNCPGAPNFEYSVTGDADFTSGDTNVPSTGQVVDNNPGIEVVYGQADPQQNIEAVSYTHLTLPTICSV